jgi:hypothetical protein
MMTESVKVLRHPREKPVEPGDVLVACTTGPGWTLLFVNAAAVVLEVTDDQGRAWAGPKARPWSLEC